MSDTADSNKACDLNGVEIQKGDTVTTLNGGTTAKVCDIAFEADSTAFVRLRPLHSPFSRGVWHAAEHVQRIAAARR